MFRHNAIALAVSGLSALSACSTVSVPERAAAPERAALPARAGTVQPLMVVRNSGGVDSEGMYRIGRVFQGQLRYDDAVVAYRKALALDPANVEARNALAVVYATQGLALDSEREFQAAIAQSPALSHLHSNLGYHYLQLGRTDEAIAALREAVRLDPANSRALNNLAAAGGSVTSTVTLARSAPTQTSAAVVPAEAVAAPQAPPTQVTAPVEHAPAAITSPETPAKVANAPATAPAVVVVPAALPMVVPAPDARAHANAASVAPPAITAAPTPPVAAVAPPAVHTAANSAAPGMVTEVMTTPPAARALPTSAPIAVVVPETNRPVSIAELVGTAQIAPKAQLVGLAPNVWELRPQSAKAVATVLPVSQSVVVQGDGAFPVYGNRAIARLEISNGNGITGLARRVGVYLKILGMSAPRLTNQRPFAQRHTQIQYVPGMEESARELMATLGTPADLVVTPKIDRNAQVRVVLGKDFHEIEAVARAPRGAWKQSAFAPREARR